MRFPSPDQAGRFWLLALVFSAFTAASPGARAETITLSQAHGGELQLPGEARSLVTLSPHLTELVYAAGAGDRLAATVAYSEYPPQAADLPRVGDAFRIDTERIHLIGPDLVLAWQTGNPPEAINHLRSLGFAVWILEIRLPRDIASAIEAIGRATGNEPTARAAADSIRNRILDLEQRYAQRAPVSYFYQISAQPLYTVNGEHLISLGLKLCGGENVFDGIEGLAPQVSMEAVLMADPQVLIAPEIPGQADPFAQWREWPRLGAVRQENFLALPADAISRATPRFIDAVELACSMMDDLRGSG